MNVPFVAVCSTLLAVAAAAVAQPGAGAPPAPGYELLFAEEFDADRVNERDWNFRVGPRTGTGIAGLNLARNVRVGDGHLIIEAKREVVDGKTANTGGGLISKHRFGYGYYECRSQPFMGGRGVPAPLYQWRRDAVALAGATDPVLLLTAGRDIEDSYSVVVSNSEGAATSEAAVLALSDSGGPGHLRNLSVLTELSAGGDSGGFALGYVVGSNAVPRLVNASVRKPIDAGGSLTAGFVLGGTTAGTILIRAVGRGLDAFGVPGTMSDPQLTLYGGITGGEGENTRTLNEPSRPPVRGTAA